MTGRSGESVSVPEEIRARLTRPTIRLSGSVGHPMVASFFEWVELRFGFAEKPDGALALSLMLVWRRGRAVALARRSEDAMPLDLFIASLSRPDAPIRVPGTAIYLTTQRDVVPSALALNLKPQRVVELGTKVEI